MANVYHKILNSNIGSKYAERIINGIQSDLTASTCEIKSDLFDITQDIRTKRTTLDVDSLLKYYVINQMLKEKEDTEPKKVEKKYLQTANKNIKKDLDENKYYREQNGEWILVENIYDVLANGNYVVKERKFNSGFTFKKLYNDNDELINVQILDCEGNTVSRKHEAIELMDMKQEYVKKYKYAGYSGNSNDIVAALLNKFTTPVETGYYMDKQYNLYKWNDADKSFYMQTNVMSKSPLLTDYDFENSRKVIRKEYTGVK